MTSIVIYLIELHQLYLHAKNILQQHNLFSCTISIKACFSISSISIKTHHELLLRRRGRIRAISLGCCCCCCCCYGPGGGDWDDCDAVVAVVVVAAAVAAVVVAVAHVLIDGILLLLRRADHWKETQIKKSLIICFFCSSEMVSLPNPNNFYLRSSRQIRKRKALF